MIITKALRKTPIKLKIKSLEADIVKTNTENAEKIVSDYEWLNSTITKSGKTAQEVADEWGISGEKLRAELENQNISLDEWVQNAEESARKWQESFDSHKDAVINSFEEIPEKLDMSFEDMTENLNKNAERYAEWQKNISKLSKVMSEEAVAEIIKLGPAFKLNRNGRKSGL